MNKYKVSYQGFSYVEADSKDEAIDKTHNMDTIYDEMELGNVEIVDDFEIDLED